VVSGSAADFSASAASRSFWLAGIRAETRRRAALGFCLHLVRCIGDGGAGVAEVRSGAAAGVVGCSHDFLLRSEDCVFDLVGLALDDIRRGDLVRYGVDVGSEPCAGCFNVGTDGIRVLTHCLSSL